MNAMRFLKSLFRPLPLLLVAAIIWTCRLTDTQGPDTLTLKLPDSLKASVGKYDSIHVFVVVVQGSDTAYRRLVFHGAYNDSAQLRNLPMPGLPSDEFTVILIGYRDGERVLQGHLNFKDGSSSGPPVIELVIPPGGGGSNRPPYQGLAAPDAGKEAFRIREGRELAFRVLVGDSDGGDVASRLPLENPLPSDCGSPSYDTATGQFRFTAAFACVDSMGDSSEAVLRFVARDRGNPPLYDTLRVKVTVEDSNSAPKWAKAETTLSGKEGKPMSLNLDSLFLGDLEGDSVSFTATLGSVSALPPAWSFSPGFSDAGEKTVVITATDNHQPPMSSQFTLRLTIADSVRALDVVIYSPPNGYATRDSVVAVRWRVNGQEQAVRNDTLRREGANIIRRSFSDTLGKTETDSITVILDRVPPGKPAVTAPGPTNNRRPTWTWRSGGGGGAGYYRFGLVRANLASDTAGRADSTFTPANPLAEGRHVLYVQERDAAGNWSPMDSGVALVDTTKPRVVITSPPDNFVTNQGSVDVFYTVDSVAQPKVTRNLVLGNNRITVVGTDAAGNRDSASITVVRDTSAPGKPILQSPGLTNNNRPTWTWRSGGGSGRYRFRLDNPDLSSDTVGRADTSYRPPAPLSEGRHVLYIQERNAAGTWSPLDSGAAVIDTTKPAVIITWPPNNYATNRDSVLVQWTLDSAVQTPARRTLAVGNNLVKVVGTDAAGNRDSASVNVVRDTTPPNRVLISAPGLTNNRQPRWSWRTGGGGGSGRFRYNLVRASLASDTAGNTDTAFVPGTPLSEGRHVLYVQERDAAGNWSPVDSGVGRVDVTAPAVVIVSPANGHVTNQSSVQVQWRIDGVNQAAVNINLNEGDNTLTRQATDSAGNTGSTSITVTRRSRVLFVNSAQSVPGDGNSWVTANRHLQVALTRATSGDTIWVARGLYKPFHGLPGFDSAQAETSFVMKQGVVLYGGFSGAERANSLRNWATNETILSGHRGDTSVIEASFAPIVTGATGGVLDGFVLEKAFVKGYSGALANLSASPQILNCVFRDNVNANSGPGAIVNINSVATIRNCTFIRNRGSFSGGAMLNSNASPTVSTCRFEDNWSSFQGGAVYGDESSAPVFSSCIFRNNRATHGAGVYDKGLSTYQGNFFIGNIAADFGGGAFVGEVVSGTTIHMVNNVFSGNSAQRGGGIYSQSAALTVLNSTFSANVAGDTGGAIFLAEPFLGIQNTVAVSIRNSIFWGNSANYAGSQIGLSSEAPSSLTLNFGYSNLSGGAAGISRTGNAVLNSGSGIIQINPLFRNSASLSGPDGAYFTGDDGLSLSSGSPSVNTGDPSTTGLPSLDLAGSARVQGGRVDMGAYEQ